MSRRRCIRGGLVVTPKGIRRAEVVVDGDRIVSAGARADRGVTTIDASGCYVLPGGIDSHTHLLTGVFAATRSAAFGGTTTALCFTSPRPGEAAADAVTRARADIEGQSMIDVDLHAVIGEPDRLTTGAWNA